jgi:hypothetical protein
MVTKYYQEKINPQAPWIRQCQLVNIVQNAKVDCPGIPGKIPSDWDQDGDPFPTLGDSNCMGYHAVQTYNPNSSSVPLTPQVLAAQIAAGLPVVFDWLWIGLTVDSSNQSGNHWIVAEGIPHSSYINTHMWVSVNDPLPAGRGRHRIISYPEYANQKPMTLPGYPPEFSFSTHGVDYYQLTYTK